MAKTYYIETFGCQMNVHDSERLGGLLEQAGYEPIAAMDDADLVVVNTCSVRERRRRSSSLGSTGFATPTERRGQSSR